MLTLNTRMAPIFGTKFKPSVQQRNNFYNNSQISQPSLSGMPSEDTFIRQNNVSFKGSIHTPLVGRPDNEIYMKELEMAIGAKFDEVWDWAKNNEKYKPYFEKLNIEKPKVTLVQGGKPMSAGRDTEKIADYNWIGNMISLNLSFLPNLVAVSGGELNFMAQNVSYYPLVAHDPTVNDIYNYLEMGHKDVRAALENSEKWKNERYYYKLTPEETMELAGGYFAHEIDHLIMTHILFNTEGLSTNPNPARKTGNHAFQPYFEQLKKIGYFPDNVSRRWEDSYAYNYRAKEPGRSVYSAEDKWELDAHKGFKRRIKLKDVLPLMFTNPKKHMRNYLDLSGQCAALEYVESHRPKKFGDEKTDDMMDILYEHTKAILEEDIQDRKERVK